VIPTYTRAGKPASYMARTFCDEPKRYLYPRSEENPDLDVMFGEARWEPDQTVVVVTEGAFDALAVERDYARAGGAVAVAALGGSIVRPMHAAKLSAFRRVVIFTDADAAGDASAAELTAYLARHTSITRVRSDARDEKGKPMDADKMSARGMLTSFLERMLG